MPAVKSGKVHEREDPCADQFVSEWHKLESLGKREPQWEKNASIRLAYGQV